MAIQFTEEAVDLILQIVRETGLDPEATVFNLQLKDGNIMISFVPHGQHAKSFKDLKIQASLELAQRYDVFVEKAESPKTGLIFRQKKLF